MLRQTRWISDRTSGRTFLFLKKKVKSLCGSWINLELLYLDKYQSEVSTCPTASNRISVVFKEHLVAFSLTIFAYASKLNRQPSMNFFITKVCHFIHHAGRKATTKYEWGIRRKEYITEDVLMINLIRSYLFYKSMKIKQKTLRMYE